MTNSSGRIHTTATGRRPAAAGPRRLPRQPRRRFGIGILTLAGSVALSTAVLLADYKSSYVKGLLAVDSKDWSEVVRQMREAIRENPKEGESVRRYGMVFETYLPQFYLGLAMARLGDCQGAMVFWQESERQGAVRNSGHYRELVAGRTDCQAKVGKAATPTTPTPSQPTNVAPPGSKPLAPPDTKPVAPDTKPVAPVAKPEPPPTTPLRPEPGNPPAATPPPVTPPVEPPATPRQPSVAAIPPVLLAAVQAYFQGNYAVTDRTLTAINFQSARLNALARLFRAAARYALYLLGGGTDGQLRQGAIVDIQMVRRLDPEMKPDERYFSPRFTQFFSSVQ